MTITSALACCRAQSVTYLTATQQLEVNDRGKKRLHKIFKRGLAPFLLLCSEPYLTSAKRQVLFHNPTHAETFPDYLNFCSAYTRTSLLRRENWIQLLNPSQFIILKSTQPSSPTLTKTQTILPALLQTHIYDPHLLTILPGSSPLI